jgi:uncharacterized protein (TIGR02466 family)
MEKKIHFLFPTPIIKTKFPEPFTKEQLELVHNTPIGKSVGNRSSASRRILDEPGFEEIKKFAQECLDVWVDDVLCPRDKDSIKLGITQSWLNYTNPGGFHHAHYHPNSVVSGVIYIQADNELDEIQFQQDAAKMWHVDNDRSNEFNSNQYHVPVKTGDVVLFPSQMYHGVPELKGQLPRISLAFNSFFTGRLGFPDDKTNYLEIHGMK